MAFTTKDTANTVVNTNDWFVPNLSYGSGHDCCTLKGGTHARTLGITDYINVIRLHARLL